MNLFAVSTKKQTQIYVERPGKCLKRLVSENFAAILDATDIVCG